MLTVIAIVWGCSTPETPETFSIRYVANGGTSGAAPRDGTKYESGDKATIREPGSLLRVGYEFGGWNTAADGSGTSYAVGAVVTVSRDISLYADWLKTVTGTVTPPAPLSLSISGPGAATYDKASQWMSSFTGSGATPSYQWYLNGNALTGSTGASLTATPVVGTWFYGANLLTILATDASGVTYSGSLTVSVGN